MNKYFVTVDNKGNTRWYKDAKGTVLHRTDGPAIEYTNGDKSWYMNDQRHRTDGPAIEYAGGEQHWYSGGKRHRTDGPAIEYTDGYKVWYLNGTRVTEQQHQAQTAPVQEMTMAQLEAALGKRVKIIK